MTKHSFVEFRGAGRKANDEHFYACQEEGTPLVIVRLGRRYATLEWDCITLHRSMDAHVRAGRGTLLLRGMYDRFCALAKGEPGNPKFLGSAFTGTITRLLPSTARLLAKEYFQLLEAGGPTQSASQIK
jgi:hypothetical protein